MSTVSRITERFRQALDYAATRHATQTRKASDVPYLAHLLGVCSLVMDHTTDEDVWIAALLHDAVEDQGGEATAREIEALFGPRVGSLVRACTEILAPEDQPKIPWLQRKQQYLKDIALKDADALLIVAADKLHNARAVLSDWIRCGDDSYCKFTTGKLGTQWYYQQVIAELENNPKSPKGLVNELKDTVERFAPETIEVTSLDAL